MKLNHQEARSGWLYARGNSVISRSSTRSGHKPSSERWAAKSDLTPRASAGTAGRIQIPSVERDGGRAPRRAPGATRVRMAILGGTRPSALRPCQATVISGQR
jgi:hypothetical protein